MRKQNVRTSGTGKVTFLAAAAGAVASIGSHGTFAATIQKADNNTNLATGTSWVGGVVPTTADLALFDNTVTTALSVNQGGGSGANLTFGSIQLTNPGGAVTIVQNGANNLLTLGTGGIDMSAATNDLTFTLGTIRAATANFGLTFNVASGRTLTVNNVTNQGNNKTLTLSGSGNVIVNGVIGNSTTAPLAFNVNGANVTLNGATGFNAGTGALTLTTGTLNLGNDSALSSVAGTPALVINGGTLAASGAARTVAVAGGYTLGGNATVGGSNALTLNSAFTNSGGDRTLTISNSALTTLAQTVNLSNNATNRTLTLNGAGSATISGVVTNGGGSTASNLTYSGTGVLSLSNANTFTGTLNANGGTVRIDNSLAAQSSTVSVGADNALAFGTGITSATFGGLSGAGALALTNTGAGAVALSVGNGNVTSTYTGLLSGAGTLTKIGNGTLTLSGASTGYANGISLSAGTLSLGNTSAAGTGGITALNGTTFNVATNSTTFAGNTLTVSGANANVTLTTGNVSGGFSGGVTGSSDQTLTVSGANAVNLSSSTKQLQNFSGTVSIGVGANLAFRSSALNNGSDNALFQVNGGLSTRNGGAVALGALTGSGTVSMGGSGGNNIGLTYTLGARGGTADFSGVISDADAVNGKIVSIVKTGAGTQILSGTNTYTGTTGVNAGRLLVNGSTAGGSAVSVTGTGTLGGSGFVNGSTSVSGGGTLAPGNSIDSIDTGNLTFGSGGHYAVELDASTVTTDVTNVTGTVTLDTGAVLDAPSVAGTLAASQLYFIVANDAADAVTGTAGIFTSYPQDSVVTTMGGYTLNISYVGDSASSAITGGNDIVLYTQAIPEPATFGLIGMAGLGLLGSRRRRAK